jgi:poly(3-hydroxybutyrate) depolymerase
MTHATLDRWLLHQSQKPSHPRAAVRWVVNGATRTYTLHVPVSYQARVGALVVGLHGAGASENPAIGGRLAHRACVELSDLIPAIGAVSGWLS